ncbi:hypothetical protein [Candidatus Protochlamydia amoebophila]|uniref:Uncharacterized protein n=1 Tax=Protochlamydia amoebophila (strain UWE25) TaxID=264201 RepID=Q6MF55_PARUW|nr:hypothetical protein [Candidatus Protochlamydia amoebophila]CAF22794.1 unnamed protein product [Candidatus Protochlamydia amoebophila UWE25]
MSLSLLYAKPGAFNFLRAKLESHTWGKITFAYDFYGRKFLPALSPQYDIQLRTFEKIKNVMDGLYFITFFPPRISYRFD